MHFKSQIACRTDRKGMDIPMMSSKGHPWDCKPRMSNPNFLSCWPNNLDLKTTKGSNSKILYKYMGHPKVSPDCSKFSYFRVPTIRT